MFNWKPNRQKSALDLAIEDVLKQMDAIPADSKEYAAMVKQLNKLHAMKMKEKPSRVSKDALVAATANILGIAVIVGYEQKHIITSKALPFVGKFR